ncbi:MAG: DMT family transporter, partial [Sediminibacterium sp.]|nr:DMT family transporter [Sediminibacterium sp.]
MNKAYFQLHVAVFLAGFTGILGFLISLNGVVLTFYRLIIAVIFMVIIALWKRKKYSVKPHQKSKLIVIGILLSLHWIAFYQSIKLANISVAVICLASTSCFTAIFSPIIQKSKIYWQELVIGILGLIGMYIIFIKEPVFDKGIIVGTISAFLSSMLTIFSKKIAREIKPQTQLFYEFIVGIIICFMVIVLWLITDFKNIQPKELYPNFQDLIWITILSIVCTIILQQLLLTSLKRIKSFTVNLVFNLEIVYSIILAFIFFQEEKQLNEWFYFGAAIICASIII